MRIVDRMPKVGNVKFSIKVNDWDLLFDGQCRELTHLDFDCEVSEMMALVFDEANKRHIDVDVIGDVDNCKLYVQAKLLVAVSV